MSECFGENIRFFRRGVSPHARRAESLPASLVCEVVAADHHEAGNSEKAESFASEARLEQTVYRDGLQLVEVLQARF